MEHFTSSYDKEDNVMYRKTVMLAVPFLAILYVTTHIIFETLYRKPVSFFSLLCFSSILEGVIIALIAAKILREKNYFSYGIVFLALYILLLLIGYIAFRTAAYSQRFSEEYWIYFPSLASIVHMPVAVGGHLLTVYILSKRRHY